MSADVPRLRMFAGPNGSGKTTVKRLIDPKILGLFVNPDEIEEELRERKVVDLASYGIAATQEEFLGFFNDSALVRKAKLLDDAKSIGIVDGKLNFGNVKFSSYFASVTASFIRRKLLARRASFSFETVMSSPDKVAFVREAQQIGKRTYLYFVATEDPAINIARVHNRVLLGGHPVPEDKIVSRYERSLGLLSEAIRYSNRAYIFDNSDVGPIWFAEFTDGTLAGSKAKTIPEWFTTTVPIEFLAGPRS